MREFIVYQYPLPGCNAQLIVPRDLTWREAEKLAEFIRLLWLAAKNE